MLKLDFDLADLHAQVDAITDAVASGIRPAAQAGAQVFYDEIKANVARIGRVTGNLDRAVYQKFSEENSQVGVRAEYHVSWNYNRAPHGLLVENGHIQRYVTHVGKDGNWFTAVRPNMRGKPRPKRKAPQAVKDLYYVTLPAPIQVAAQPFFRPAWESKKSMVPQVIWEHLKAHIQKALA